MPGGCAFANWLKRTSHANRDDYTGGVSIWVHQFGQCYEKKVAYASAFTKVLVEEGVRAYAMNRLD